MKTIEINGTPHRILRHTTYDLHGIQITDYDIAGERDPVTVTIFVRHEHARTKLEKNTVINLKI